MRPARVLGQTLGSDMIFILLKNPHDFLLFLGLGHWRMSHSL